jgi:hypothetical protein
MTESELPEISFGPCCFCNQQIAESDIDLCAVRVETAGGKWQVWYCHADCFRERLVRRDDGFFDPVHF